VTTTYEVPADWLPRDVSRKALLLVNAFAFSKSATPPMDQWTHFAKLRPVPWKLVAILLGAALMCVWAFVGVLDLAVEEAAAAIPFLILTSGGALFFGGIVVMSVASYNKRTGWPHLHGLGIGESGIALRFTGGDADVPWDAVTAISAVFTNADNPKKANIPVLRVQYADATVDLNTQILGAHPMVIFCALTYYWQNPASRGELGTTVAQQRMDAWLAQVPGGPGRGSDSIR